MGSVRERNGTQWAVVRVSSSDMIFFIENKNFDMIYFGGSIDYAYIREFVLRFSE
jgi:hypothetical protein